MNQASRSWLFFTADAGESVVQVPTVQEPVGYLADHRAPEAVFFGKAIIIHALEIIEVVFDQGIKR